MSNWDSDRSHCQRPLRQSLQLSDSHSIIHRLSMLNQDPLRLRMMHRTKIKHSLESRPSKVVFTLDQPPLCKPSIRKSSVPLSHPLFRHRYQTEPIKEVSRSKLISEDELGQLKTMMQKIRRVDKCKTEAGQVGARRERQFTSISFGEEGGTGDGLFPIPRATKLKPLKIREVRNKRQNKMKAS